MSNAGRIEPVGESGFVQANGLRLHYFAYGDSGKPVLLVPGITNPAITCEVVGGADQGARFATPYYFGLPPEAVFAMKCLQMSGRG